MSNWHYNIFATSEEPQELSTGPWLGNAFPGVALPSREARNRWIIVRRGDLWTCAQVKDLGPFCHDDSAYTEDGARPRAEKLKGQPCPCNLDGTGVPTVPDGKGGFRPVAKSNGAGIDLFEAVSKALGLKIGENATVDWRYIEVTEATRPFVPA